MSGEPKTHTPGLEAKLTVAQVNALVNAIERCYEFASGHGFSYGPDQVAALEALRAAFPLVAGVRVVARDEAAELRAGFDKVVYRLDDALKEAAELRQAITEFITARREHFYYTVNESGLDVAEYNRTASRYEAALETLQRIGEP